MRIVFRADASIQIGTGHIMRCLTLAEALKNAGASCYFICREHDGNLSEYIRAKGFAVETLAVLKSSARQDTLAHSHWLGSTQIEDANASAPLLEKIQPDWLVVDHYALDAQWQQLLKPYYRKLLVIDDLADRAHIANILLDQNLGSTAESYKDLVPNTCELLIGPKYALLRPEFAHWRDYSLKRRADISQAKRWLVNLGGVDKDNKTQQVLEALAALSLPGDTFIDVIMGSTAPFLTEVQTQAKKMPWPCEVSVGVNNMAERMANADIAIGAAGSTSWERCCLGLPTIMLVLADNQISAAKYLQLEQAAAVAPQSAFIPEAFEQIDLIRTSHFAANICNGLGVASLVIMMREV